jgi:hypothetical protein
MATAMTASESAVTSANGEWQWRMAVANGSGIGRSHKYIKTPSNLGMTLSQHNPLGR